MKRSSRSRVSYRVGLALLVAAGGLPVVGLLFPVFGLPAASSNLFVSLLVAGGPEVLCLTAIALLGQAGYPRFLSQSASRWCYYGGLAYCALNTLPITIYAYAPDWLPGGWTKYLILALTDFGFILSVFFMGGEFWEKFRRLFIWEGGSPPEKDGARERT